MMPWYVVFWWWLKKNWKAVLLGLSTAGLGLLIGRVLRKPPKVVNPELVEHEKVKQEADKKFEQRVELAEEERDKRLTEVKEKHVEVVKRLTDEQLAEAKSLEQDPEALNSYLFQVGKDIRGGD